MRITHVISGLDDGGAEAVLYRLCRGDRTTQHAVVSLTDEGKYGPLLRELRIPVFSLNMRVDRIPVRALWYLSRVLRSQAPDVVQTWLYHGDLLGGLGARLAGIRAVAWGVHHTNLEPGQSKRTTIWVARACSYLSHVVPRRIICCAESSSRVHQAIGYDAEKMVVVENGYDLMEFRPRADLGMAVRAELNVPHGKRLLGMVGRFDPQKDHENLLRALSIVAAQGHDVHCLLVGRELDRTNERLMSQIEELGLSERVLPVGQRSDMVAVMNALDLHVLSSAFGEAFPNVLSEAMACGTPCVATDVGDAAKIVGDTGWIVPPKDPAALAAALVEALASREDSGAWTERQVAARRRIERHFSVEAMVAGYHKVWDSVR